MRTVVSLVLALACATGCIGRAAGSRGTTIQAAPGSDPDARPDANALPGSLHAR